MKKAHLLRCTGFARSNVLPEYASARWTLRAPRIWTFLIRLEERKLSTLNTQESFAFLTAWVLSFNFGAE
jgi:hypothetical protein